MSQRWRESAFDINSKMITENKKIQQNQTCPEKFKLRMSCQLQAIWWFIIVQFNLPLSYFLQLFLSFASILVWLDGWALSPWSAVECRPSVRYYYLLLLPWYCIRKIWTLLRYGRTRGVMVIRLNLIDHYLAELYSWSKRVPKLVSQVNLIQTSMITDFRRGWLFSL